MKAGVKTTIRLFKRHVVRLITIIAIILVSVGFMAGIGEVEKTMRLAVNERYIDSNLSDVYLKSTNPYGFTQEEISQIEQRFGADNTEKSFSYEYEEDGEVFRVYSYDLQASLINKLELLEGRFPIAADEIVAERETELFPRYEVGEKVTLQGKTYTVCGIVENPLLSLKKDERSFMFSDTYLRNVFYIQTDNLPMVNDIHALLKNRDLFDAYNAEYETEIREMKAELETELGKENVIVLSLYENAGLYSIVAYAEKVGLIAVAFVVFFLLVTLLVVYSTMSRLFEEERSQIACQKTLGYGDKQTIARYVFFRCGRNIDRRGAGFACRIWNVTGYLFCFHLALFHARISVRDTVWILFVFICSYIRIQYTAGVYQWYKERERLACVITYAQSAQIREKGVTRTNSVALE